MQDRITNSVKDRISNSVKDRITNSVKDKTGELKKRDRRTDQERQEN